MADESADSIYTDFIASLLAAEADRRLALEAKGSVVITTAGTLVTLLFGLVAVVTGTDSFTLPGAAHGWLVAAIVLFVVACGVAILVSVPVPYGETQISKDDLPDWWQEHESIARIKISSLNLKAINAARRMNAVKGLLVTAATVSLLAALVMLAVAVYRILAA